MVKMKELLREVKKNPRITTRAILMTRAMLVPTSQGRQSSGCCTLLGSRHADQRGNHFSKKAHESMLSLCKNSSGQRIRHPVFYFGVRWKKKGTVWLHDVAFIWYKKREALSCDNSFHGTDSHDSDFHVLILSHSETPRGLTWSTPSYRAQSYGDKSQQQPGKIKLVRNTGHVRWKICY